MWLNNRGGLKSNFELCSRGPLVTIVRLLFLAGQHEYRIPEEQGKQQNKHTNQIRVSENSSGAKKQELSVHCTPAVHFSADFLHQVLNHCMK